MGKNVKNTDSIILDVYYYIIKVINNKKHTIMYKIGEGLQSRPKSLVKKYSQLKYIDAEILYIDTLPHNNKKRLNDKTIHKNLTKLNHVDDDRVKGMLLANDGCTEFFELSKEYPNINVVEYVKGIVDDLAKNPANFKRNVSLTENTVLTYEKKQKHQVPWEITETMLNMTTLKNIHTYHDKVILLIGQFIPDWIATFAMNNIVYILHDSSEEKYTYQVPDLNKHINYLNDIKELLDMSKNTKIDLIIANPPYMKGNEITNTIINNVAFDDYVNLMPVKYYRGKDLYKHVEELELVDPKAFKDAKITDNLCACKLTDCESDNNKDKDFSDFVIISYNKDYLDFYKKNNDIKDTFSYIPVHATKSNEKAPNVLTSFMITMRTILDGTHKFDGIAADIDWNIKNKTDNIPWDNHVKAASCAFICFDTAKAKCNFNIFWYKNELMNNLIKGLNGASGKVTPAIPNIDWSKDRDYEHCTLDDIMKWLDEDNK